MPEKETKVSGNWFECAVCPKCENRDDLFYGQMKEDGASLAYPFRCPECGFTGHEVYGVEFSHMTNEDGKMEL